MLTPDIDPLNKTTYDNDDGSPKNVQTPATQVGAWDMEEITAKIDEYLEYVNLIKQGKELSESNPSFVYGLMDGNWVQAGVGVDKYLIRVADSSANYNINIDFSEGFVYDPKLIDFNITFNPSDMSMSTYLIDIGVASSASEGNFYLRINNDGTLRLRRNDASNGNTQVITTVDTLNLNDDNLISLVNGVLTINGVDQLVDMSAFDPVTTVTQGVHFFALSNNGSNNLIGDIKAMSYAGESLIITQFAANFPTIIATERGTATYVLY